MSDTNDAVFTYDHSPKNDEWIPPENESLQVDNPKPEKAELKSAKPLMCRKCNKQFTGTGKRGRPAVVCPACRVA